MSKTSKGSGKSPWKRYAVTRDQTKVAQLSVFKQGKDLKFQVTAETADVLEQLRSLLGKLKADSKKQRRSTSNREDSSKAGGRSLAARLEEKGFGLKLLPAADFQMSVEINIDSGRRVGAVKQLHEFANSSEVERRVFDALANAGRSTRTKLVKQVEKSLNAGDLEGAAKALVEWSAVGTLFGVQESDLALARAIPLGQLTPQLREDVLSVRLFLAGKLNDLGEATAADLKAELDEFGDRIDTNRRAALAGFEGAVANARGYVATAIRHWKAAVKGTDSTRAHAHADLCKVYPVGDPEAASLLGRPTSSHRPTFSQLRSRILACSCAKPRARLRSNTALKLPQRSRAKPRS